MGAPAVSGLSAGARLGPYRLVRPLGQGGFANVWAAIEEGPHGFSKRLALKVLRKSRDDSDKAWATLVNEARVGGQLRHPNLVDIYRIEEHDGTWVIAMELIEGRDLGHLLKQLRRAGLTLPPSVVTEVGLQVARALEYAHAARDDADNPLQLVHRDLKPANVLVSDSGAVKVADFGIAKAATNMESTTAGQLKGTPYYMAPEVWAGERDFLPRIDLFALGVMLWEMTMGERLFSGETPGAMAAQALFGDASQEASRVSSSFPSLEPLLTKLLQRDPELRTQTATEVVQELRKVAGSVEAPGGLSLYLKLLDVGLAEPEDRDEAASARLPMPETVDGSWTQLYRLVRGDELPSMAETRDFATAGPAGTGRLIELRAAGANSRWAPSQSPLESVGETTSISQLRQANELPSSLRQPLTPANGAAGDGTVGPTRVARPKRRRPAPRPTRAVWIAAVGLFVLLVGGTLAIVGPQLAPGPEAAEPEAAAAMVADLAMPAELDLSAPEPEPVVAEARPAPPVRENENENRSAGRAGGRVTPEAARPKDGRQDGAHNEIENEIETAIEASPPSPAAPEPKPAAEPPPQPVAEAAPAPKPAAAAPSGDGCLTFQSTPPGADVTLDGQAAGLARNRGQRSVSPGSHTVAMGGAKAPVYVEAGMAYVVHCSLVAGGGCTVKPAGTCR